MNFLSRLLSRFVSFTRAHHEDRLGQPPADSEPLSRFIFPKNHFHRQTMRPKPDAFLPSGTPPQASVFRTIGLTSAEIWQIGLEIGSVRGRTLRARADVFARAVLDTGLVVDPDDTPPRHANIIGWPEEKHEQLMLATELAEAATLHIKPGDSAT
jgi:hypothetical protein